MAFIVSKSVVNLTNQYNLKAEEAAGVKIFRRVWGPDYFMTKPNRLEMAVHRLACFLGLEKQIENKDQIVLKGKDKIVVKLLTNQKNSEPFKKACYILSSLVEDVNMKQVYEEFLIATPSFSKKNSS